jgi:NADPH-dependent 2,4-dienoyl-CoA reductase/sulfur reductase-like enzyme
MTAAFRPDTMDSEVLVIGAGPAGMAAGVRARESGAKVLIVDDNPISGGQIWRGGQEAHKDRQSALWFERFRKANVPVLTGAQVVSAAAPGKTVLVETWGNSLELRYKKLIIAAGAREIFLPFPNWTLPGIAGVGGLQALAKSGLPMTGKSVVVAGSGPLLLAVAASLRNLGANVKLIAEQATRQSVMRFAFGLLRHPAKVTQAAALQYSLLGIPYRYGCWVEAAEGNGRLEGLALRQENRRWTEQCDYAGIAFGLYPNVELPSLLGCRLQNDAVEIDDCGRTSVEDIYCAGECTGIGGVDLSLVEGEIAGHSAAGRDDRASHLFAARKKARHFADRLNTAFALRHELKALAKDDTFVCRCEDVTYGRLKNISSFRAAKLHTRCGMGPCQGRVCGPATQFLFGWRAESIRPPIFPARVRSLVIDEAVPEEAAPIPQ